MRHTDCAGCIVGKDVGTCDQTAGADGESPSMARLLDRLAELDRPLTPPELLPRSVMRGLNRAGRAPDRSGTAWWTIPFVSARQTDIMSGASMLCGCALDDRCRLLSRLCETHCVGPSGLALVWRPAHELRCRRSVAPRGSKKGRHYFKTRTWGKERGGNPTCGSPLPTLGAYIQLNSRNRHCGGRVFRVSNSLYLNRIRNAQTHSI